MPQLKTKAIVLRAIKWSESSLIVNMLTEHYGKQAFIARSALNPKSKFKALIDVLQQIDILVDYKENRDLNYLKEVDLVHNNIPLAKNYNHYYTALSLVEIVDKFTIIEELSKDLFPILVRVLKELHTARHPESFLIKFLIDFIQLSGFDIRIEDLKRGHFNEEEQMKPCLDAISKHPYDRLDRISVNPKLRKELNHFLIHTLSFHFDHHPQINSLSFLN